MNLFTFKETGPIAGHDDVYKTGITGRRYAIVADTFSFGWESQLKDADGWHGGSRYGMVLWRWNKSQRFCWGFVRSYYDDMHSALHLGPLIFTWSSNGDPGDHCAYGWGFDYFKEQKK